MSRLDRINNMWSLSISVTLKVEEVVGEMDDAQKLHVGGLLMAFWAASEDKFHPYAGHSWVDLIKDKL